MFHCCVMFREYGWLKLINIKCFPPPLSRAENYQKYAHREGLKDEKTPKKFLFKILIIVSQNAGS